MFCDNCGSKVDAGNKYCDNCGNNIAGQEIDKERKPTSPRRAAYRKILFLISSQLKKNAVPIGIGLATILVVFGLIASGILFPENQSVPGVQVASQEDQSALNTKITQLENQITALDSAQASSTNPGDNSQNTEIQDLQNQLNQLQSQPSGQGNATLSTSEVVSRVRPATVMIRTNSGCGSGMIVQSNGTILTNDHVVSGASYIGVYLNDGSIYSGQIIDENYELDLALIKISKSGLPTVSFGDSSDSGTPLGTNVVALGFPLTCNTDQTLEIDAGDITARRTVSGLTGFGSLVGPLLQTSARINPGDSGGPLVDPNGKVVGINEKIDSILGLNLTGFAFAIPSSVAAAFVDSPGTSISQNYQPTPSAIENSPPSSVTANPRYFQLNVQGVCSNFGNNGAVILNGYPLTEGYSIPSDDISFWTDGDVAFTVPTIISPGTYQVTVRGYEPDTGYCSDVPAGTITIVASS